MKKFYLKPTNGRKSFNNKCQVIEENKVSTLESYGIEVAKYDHEKNEVKILGWFSNTTQVHINSFLEFYGFDTMTKKEMIEHSKK